MAVKMRLRREGKKKQPFYRVVVADVRSPRDGRFIEDLGFYHPTRDPSAISIDRERALHWLRNGVKPSDAVLNLLRIEGIWEEFKPGDPGKERSQRNRAQAAARAEAKGQGPAAAPAAETDTAQAPEAGTAPAPETGTAQAADAGTAPDPREQASDEVVEQAIEEDTQPAPGPVEETGAVGAEPAPADEADAVGAEGAEADEAAQADETARQEDTSS